MELFSKAKVVRLRSHHDKYLLAEDDEAVMQDRNGSSRQARWTVEFIKGEPTVIRLKSSYGKYLTASNKPFILGMTGLKVLQTVPRRLDSSVEWEPVMEGFQVKLKTRYGNFLRANGGVPPWRNSVTHDVPQRTATQDWILWDVDVIEVRMPSPERVHVSSTPSPKPISPERSRVPRATSSKSSSPARSRVSRSASAQSGSPHHFAPSFTPSRSSSKLPPELSKKESWSSLPDSPPKPGGRRIVYYIADDNGKVDESLEGHSFFFKGSSVQELAQMLEEETRLDGLIVCNRSPINGKLYPLRLQLPPNNAAMNVVVVRASSKF